MRGNHHQNTQHPYQPHNPSQASAKRSHRGSSIKFHPFKIDLTRIHNSTKHSPTKPPLLPHQSNQKHHQPSHITKSKNHFIQTAPSLNLSKNGNNLLQEAPGTKRMENYLVTDRSRISSSIEAQQYDYDDIMLITSNTSRSNNVHNTSRIVLESLNDDTFTKTEESNHHPAHVKTPLDKNIEHLNQAYHTIKKEIKDKNVKSEWENFMNNFNGIFEKLKLENIELKTKLSQAPESSRRQVEIQGRDSIEQDEFQNLNSSRRLYEKFAQEEKFFKEKEQLTAENAQLKKELADQKTQIDLMNQNFDESLSQQVNTKV